MLNEVRQGLSLAGESGPYILFPHSMSGLEAVYWAQQYPDEVTAIIGLDMAVPEAMSTSIFKPQPTNVYWTCNHLAGAAQNRVSILLMKVH